MNAIPPNLPRDVPREFIARIHLAAVDRLAQLWRNQPAGDKYRGASFLKPDICTLTFRLEN